MNALLNWHRNRLLLALSSRDLKRLMPELEHIRCQREQILMDADSSLDHVYFPDSGSLLRRQDFLRPASRPNPGECSQDVARCLRMGDRVDAIVPKSHVRLHSGLSRAGPGVSSV